VRHCRLLSGYVKLDSVVGSGCVHLFVRTELAKVLRALCLGGRGGRDGKPLNALKLSASEVVSVVIPKL
jgi:hypothetical protein